jgi:hypothetical protein
VPYAFNPHDLLAFNLLLGWSMKSAIAQIERETLLPLTDDADS